ncbi:cytochrome C oxidase subunit IV family protein [Gordonia sp. SL306]|uniref:cytochrome C oxidase subunit IV family protein n=1 Tax=Gordonia sp. SL306 TaxID=2995145 RepID=UPI00226EB1C5|nr:cytochrome C oxidase subunit IV family protein [Gordonia sp. SL306]WAC54034.1 cytochrome C oxidase subunit IV family protein [Gordonia sp. SL306]
MTLSEVVGRRYVRTWLILVLLAVVIPIVSRQTHAGTAATVVVLALAAYKVRLVGLDFMEIRSAPKGLRWAFETYCVGLWVVLAGAFLLL